MEVFDDATSEKMKQLISSLLDSEVSGVKANPLEVKPPDTSWFVLYVRSDSEAKILRLMTERIDTAVYTPFIPMKDLPVRSNQAKLTGAKSKREYCFPGYIFFETAKTKTVVKDFYRDVVRLATNIDGVFRFLCYGNNINDIEMRENERALLKKLMRGNFCMDTSVGFRVGDKIHITEGALQGFESIIVKINKHKGTCECGIDMMGTERLMTLQLSIVDRG